MSVAKKTPLIKIEVSQGKKRRLYLVSRADAAAIEAILERFEGRSSNEDFTTVLRKNRWPIKMCVRPTDVSKIEKDKRPTGKKTTIRIGRALGIDYRRFL